MPLLWREDGIILLFRDRQVIFGVTCVATVIYSRDQTNWYLQIIDSREISLLLFSPLFATRMFSGVLWRKRKK